MNTKLQSLALVLRWPPLTQKVEVQALAKHGKWNPLKLAQSYPVGAVHHGPQSFGAMGQMLRHKAGSFQNLRIMDM